ncbi:MAG: hypothetical protein KKF89_03675 [Nanoarchaeota archaeon]|nr:hypothetical protein [Nanoarchaeota archaeon]MBU1854795.1 hypothetical protein [Nanoarchaeota archaeon]
MKDLITSDDILGKQAVDPDGTILGIVVKLHISNESKKIIGLTVDMGFMKPDLFIGIDFVQHFGVDAVLLNRVPTSKFEGLKVLTFEGTEIGIVEEALIYRKHLKELIVSTKKGLFSKENITISASQISKIGGSVVLKKSVKLK